MNLSELMVDTKSAWVEHPAYEGLEIELVNLSRPELTALRKRCVTTKFDKNTRKPVEELNEEKFIAEFTKATIKDWKGFKYKYLEDLMLVDLSAVDPEKNLEYSQENAKTLITNSGEFDTWVNDTVFDLDNFRTRTEKPTVAATGKVAE
jgi:U3 small nucleolar ribonucleoprotein component